MNAAPTLNWKEANQNHLTAALSEVRVALARFLSYPDGQANPEEDTTNPGLAPEGDSATKETGALEMLCATFGLSAFESKILLMSAGVELDSRFAGLYTAASRDAKSSYPTFSLALSAFED